MIKQTVINKIEFILSACLLLFVSYILRINLILPLFLLSLAVYLLIHEPNLKTKPYKLLNLSLLFVIIFVTSYIIIKQGWPIFYIPFSVIPMLAIILFNDTGITLLLTFASALSIANIAGNNLLGLLFLISGIFSCLLAKDARKRSVIMRTGLLAGLIQAISLFFIERLTIQHPMDYLILMLNGIASGIIVTGILPVFEYLFRSVTNISLLELADFNSPLLQRMIIEAPGTYHHSLIVGNLSDAASKAVGAHELLARIGAYYHDIGKLVKPDYFSENQAQSGNKHDNLAPAMSKMVIMNHVKEGLELAKKYRLNTSIIEFIQRHHGNSLVYYFYRRALENLEMDQEVEEERFRYPGPKPNTKETAIVLLADSVEAAARSLKGPTAQGIEELVHKIINNKFIDGQLDECDLTLKDIEKISAVFIRILTGIYHGRITYPEKSSN